MMKTKLKSLPTAIMGISLFALTACETGPPSPELRAENRMLIEQENAAEEERMWEMSEGDPMPTVGQPPAWERPVN